MPNLDFDTEYAVAAGVGLITIRVGQSIVTITRKEIGDSLYTWVTVGPEQYVPAGHHMTWLDVEPPAADRPRHIQSEGEVMPSLIADPA